jgi:hypothetical protein
MSPSAKITILHAQPPRRRAFRRLGSFLDFMLAKFSIPDTRRLKLDPSRPRLEMRPGVAVDDRAPWDRRHASLTGWTNDMPHTCDTGMQSLVEISQDGSLRARRHTVLRDRIEAGDVYDGLKGVPAHTSALLAEFGVYPELSECVWRYWSFPRRSLETARLDDTMAVVPNSWHYVSKWLYIYQKTPFLLSFFT